jgi:hypothetical protein
MPKSTKAEVDSRIHEVFKLRLGGAELPDLREYAQAQSPPWGVSDGQLWRYVKAADALCVKYLDAKSEHLLARHLLQRRQLYAHAMGAGDFRTALAVLESEARLEALDPLTRLRLREAEELEQRIAELERRHDQDGRTKPPWP